MTLMTPGGMPALAERPVNANDTSGASSEGLTTMVLPAAIAGPTPEQSMIAGTFQARIIPLTPHGSLQVKPAWSVEWDGSVTPITLSARPAAYSRFPAATSMLSRAADKGFPTSRASIAASSSRLSRISSAHLRINAPRSVGERLDQFG